MRKSALVLFVVACAAAVSLSPRSGGAAVPARPNVVVIMTDDQTVEALRVMGNVKRLVGGTGATFTNSFASFPLCCPSRATLLTGQYAHNHRVTSNVPPYGGYEKFAPIEYNTLPVWLEAAGYRTVHIGKYLNGYGRGESSTFVPPGWSEWYGSIDPTTYRFFNYTLNENGRLVHYGESAREYQADVYSRKAADAIRRWARESPRNAGVRPTPLFLSVAYLAPHGGAPREPDDPAGYGTPAPAPRHRNQFATEPLPRPRSFNEPDVSDKPSFVRYRPRLDAARIADVTEGYRQQLESLLAVDEGVASIVGALRSVGELDNTLIVFTSDNGYFHGEHRILSGKGRVYEPAVRVPLVIRGPGIPRGVRVREPVTNVDLAATIVDLTRVAPGLTLDGVSLVPLARDRGRYLGRDLLLETRTFSAIRTPRYLYVRHGNAERELYDLQSDPNQLRSRHADPRLRWLRSELSRRLGRLRACAGTRCRVVPRIWLRATCSSKGARNASLRGEDLRWVRSVEFRLDGARAGTDTAPPFAVRLSDTVRAVRAIVTLADGRVVTLDRAAQACRRR